MYLSELLLKFQIQLAFQKECFLQPRQFQCQKELLLKVVQQHLKH